MRQCKLRLGVAGLGRAFTLMLPTFVADGRVELVAGADPRVEARRRFAADFNARTYEAVEELCRDAAVEAVYVATPHQFHAEHVRIAAAHGKHILVEKPMALTVADCLAMIDAARRARVRLVVGHSHSFDAPIRRTREMIDSGAFGGVRMITALNFTDFMYRPRRPEELATEAGGGVSFSQAAHQIDIVRLLGGGLVKTVRATTGSWDQLRGAEGAYSAFLAFEGGVAATAIYSGYGHFDSDEFCGWIGEMGQAKDPAAHGLARKALRSISSPADEIAAKNARNYGGANYVPGGQQSGPALHQHFGFVLVSCERADLRPVPNGVMIYADEERRLDPLPPPVVPRVEVIDELFQAVVHGKAPVHSGEWALATLEVCLAILRSAHEQSEVVLEHQVPVTRECARAAT